MQFVELGMVTSIEYNHKPVESARKGQEVCVKIEPIPGEAPKMFGRHFDEKDFVVSKVGLWSYNSSTGVSSVTLDGRFTGYYREHYRQLLNLGNIIPYPPSMFMISVSLILRTIHSGTYNKRVHTLKKCWHNFVINDRYHEEEERNSVVRIFSLKANSSLSEFDSLWNNEAPYV